MEDGEGAGAVEGDGEGEDEGDAVMDVVAVTDGDGEVDAEGSEEALPVCKSDSRALLLTVPVAVPARDARGEFVGVPVNRGDLEGVLLARTEAERAGEALSNALWDAEPLSE